MSPSTSTTERGASSSASSLARPIRAGAFWLAILLPFFALALLASGLGTILEYLSFVAVVFINVVALVVGHEYGR